MVLLMSSKAQRFIHLVILGVLVFGSTIVAGELGNDGSDEIVKMQEASNDQIKMAPIPILGPSAVDNLSTKLGSTFTPAFLSSLALIILSELGDKTFFIAALLSMKKGAGIVFSGAISALIIMTLLSCGAGVALPALLSRKYTHIASLILFVVFGVKLVYEGIQMESDSGADGLAEVEEELSKKKSDPHAAESSSVRKIESGVTGVKSEVDLRSALPNAHAAEPLSRETLATSCSPSVGASNDANCDRLDNSGIELKSIFIHKSSSETGSPPNEFESSQSRFAFIRPIVMRIAFILSIFQMRSGVLIPAAFLEAFTLTFTAEWGDRSQISTVALAASKNIWGVNLGAILGHAFCTTLAVVGGKLLAARISEKAVTLCGGCTFLLFAILGALYNI